MKQKNLDVTITIDTRVSFTVNLNTLKFIMMKLKVKLWPKNLSSQSKRLRVPFTNLWKKSQSLTTLKWNTLAKSTIIRVTEISIIWISIKIFNLFIRRIRFLLEWMAKINTTSTPLFTPSAFLELKKIPSILITNGTMKSK